MELTEKLISLRRENGLTQLALAEKMDVSRQTIFRWESGEVFPSSDNLKRLGELYGVPVDYLINDAAERTAAVAVEEKPEEKGADHRWRNPTFKGIAIGLAIALVIALAVVIYSTGYGKGAKDAIPTYPVHVDIVDIEDIEEPGTLYGW